MFIFVNTRIFIVMDIFISQQSPALYRAKQQLEYSTFASTIICIAIMVLQTKQISKIT